MTAQLTLALLCAAMSVCFIADWLLEKIGVGDNKADAWKSLLIGLVFAGISYLTVREV